MRQNPVAANGEPTRYTVCECGHAYVFHTSLEKIHGGLPRDCEDVDCGCARFVQMSDEKYDKHAHPPSRDSVVKRLGAIMQRGCAEFELVDYGDQEYLSRLSRLIQENGKEEE